jgi:protein-L-isoaspartate(D-aspartate) O-methyltransferase
MAMNSIQDFRSFYARYVVSNVGAADERMIAAFASVERERYVGAGPWKVGTMVSGYVDTTVDDARILYQDVLIALKPEHHINNGQPSLHALCLAACNPKPGDSVLHIGAGTGYYTAILAQLIGPDGEIIAYETDTELAGLARRNLSHLPKVKVIAASGCDGALAEADVIYVNAAATQPMAVWLDAMKIGARLIFPLTPSGQAGCMLLITRVARAEYAATAVSGAAFTPCIGAVDKVMSEVLATALAKRSVRLIKSLRRNHRVDDTVWCRGDGWWLSTGEPAE